MYDIVFLIESYINELPSAETEPWLKFDKKEFQSVSCAKWAAFEILHIAQKNPMPEMAYGEIRQFAQKMDRFSRMSRNSNTDDYIIFESAFEIATDILDQLRGMMHDR